MKVFILWDPLYENPVGAYSSEESAISEMVRLDELGKGSRGSYGYSIEEFNLDEPAVPVKVPD